MAQGGDIALDMAGHRFIFSGRSSDAFPMPFLLRSSCLTGYVEVARSLGLDPFSLVRAVGIDRSCLFDPDIKIPTDPVVRLLEMSASAARVEDFALRMAETRHFSNLGPLALAARDAATLREALEVAIRYLSLHNEALLLSLEAMGGCRDLQIGNAGRPQLARPPGHRAYSGVTHRLIRQLFGGAWRSRPVWFSHGPPADLATHLRWSSKSWSDNETEADRAGWNYLERQDFHMRAMKRNGEALRNRHPICVGYRVQSARKRLGEAVNPMGIAE